ncbi:hypothetical protein BDW74DRAFT_9129 [Aspergillus multicolor]|uniref:uncharacterized protein n=1 Tax=Aspergillus multicolor TaxID=41759 RepID=UPI003CCC9527
MHTMATKTTIMELQLIIFRLPTQIKGFGGQVYPAGQLSQCHHFASPSHATVRGTCPLFTGDVLTLNSEGPQSRVPRNQHQISEGSLAHCLPIDHGIRPRIGRRSVWRLLYGVCSIAPLLASCSKTAAPPRKSGTLR